MKFRNCTSSLSPDAVSFEYIIRMLCTNIWHERNLIIDFGLPNALKDLFLEQSKCVHIR